MVNKEIYIVILYLCHCSQVSRGSQGYDSHLPAIQGSRYIHDWPSYILHYRYNLFPHLDSRKSRTPEDKISYNFNLEILLYMMFLHDSLAIYFIQQHYIEHGPYRITGYLLKQISNKLLNKVIFLSLCEYTLQLYIILKTHFFTLDTNCEAKLSNIPCNPDYR